MSYFVLVTLILHRMGGSVTIFSTMREKALPTRIRIDSFTFKESGGYFTGRAAGLFKQLPHASAFHTQQFLYHHMPQSCFAVFGVTSCHMDSYQGGI